MVLSINTCTFDLITLKPAAIDKQTVSPATSSARHRYSALPHPHSAADRDASFPAQTPPPSAPECRFPALTDCGIAKCCVVQPKAKWIQGSMGTSRCLEMNLLLPLGCPMLILPLYISWYCSSEDRASISGGIGLSVRSVSSHFTGAHQSVVGTFFLHVSSLDIPQTLVWRSFPPYFKMRKSAPLQQYALPKRKCGKHNKREGFFS